MRRLGLLLALWLGAVSLVGCGGGTASVGDAPERYRVQFRPDSGMVYRVERRLDQTIEMQLMGQTVEITQAIRQDVRWEIQAVTPGDTVYATVTTTRMTMDQAGPGIRESFDTADPDAEPPPGSTTGMVAAVSVPLRMTVSPLGNVRVVSGMDGVYNNMLDRANLETKAQRDTFRAVVRREFPADDLATDLESRLFLYTDDRVALGESWPVQSRVDGLVPVVFDGRAVLDSVSAGRLHTSISGSVSRISQDRDDPQETAVGPLQEIDIRGRQSGTVRVDQATGLLLKSQMTQSLQGTAVFVDQGDSSDVSMRIESAIATTSRIQTDAPE